MSSLSFVDLPPYQASNPDSPPVTAARLPEIPTDHEKTMTKSAMEDFVRKYLPTKFTPKTRRRRYSQLLKQIETWSPNSLETFNQVWDNIVPSAPKAPRYSEQCRVLWQYDLAVPAGAPSQSKDGKVPPMSDVAMEALIRNRFSRFNPHNVPPEDKDALRQIIKDRHCPQNLETFDRVWAKLEEEARPARKRKGGGVFRDETEEVQRLYTVKKDPQIEDSQPQEKRQQSDARSKNWVFHESE